ncbi:MAG: hypothetical protein QXF08_01805 [Nitrososphaerota archaeon]
MVLPRNVIDNILRIKKKYLEYRNGEEGEWFERERRQHVEEVNSILRIDELENLDETGLLRLANNLYAFIWWTRKEYLVDYWIKGAGGLDKLRKNLVELLYSDRSLADRFDSFRKNVKGIGVAMITEMLTYFNPREYCIWNKRVREALLKIGVNQLGANLDISRVGIGRLSGREYEALIKTLKEIAYHLRDEKALPNPDLLDVHYFLYYIAELSDTLDEEVDHEEIINMVLNIGKGLGFDVSREVPLATGTRVDVIWSTKIGNLGELKYVFEVHVKGSIDSLLVNLMKASQDPAVQKVIAVAVEEELEKIRREASAIKILSDRLLYWNLREVVKASELIDELMSVMQRLGLTKTY